VSHAISALDIVFLNTILDRMMPVCRRLYNIVFTPGQVVYICTVLFSSTYFVITKVSGETRVLGRT
jgi:hypothetical protein